MTVDVNMERLARVNAAAGLTIVDGGDVADREDDLVRELTDLADRLRRGVVNTDDPRHYAITSLQRLRVRTATADPFTAELERALADVKAELGGNAKQRCPLFSTDGVDLLGEEFPDPQWLVDRLVTRLGTFMIAGLPKSVKTWLATECAVAVATGSRVCGEFFAAEGTVAYFYAEDSRQQIRNRVRALLAGAERRLPRGRLHLRPRGEFLDLLLDEDLAWIVASARQLGPLDLLILDPLRDLHSGEEDKSDSMREVMRRLRLLGKLLGCTVGAVHHMGKPGENTSKRGGGQRARGSGAIHGSVDSGIYFLDGDKNGEDEWTSSIESEVKGARSAGFFTLTLKVDDDENGEAIRAAWTYEKDKAAAEPKKSKAELKEEAKRKEEQEDERIAFAFVRELAMRGEHLTRQGLRNHDENPLTDRGMYYAASRLIAAKRLRLGKAGVVLLPEPPAQQEER